MTDRLSIADAARLLGVSVGRVHQRIQDGSLPAERVGYQWHVHSRDVTRLRGPSPGRPFSWRSAWSVVALSVELDPSLEESPIAGWAAEWLAARDATERRRARHRLDQLLDLPERLGDDAAHSSVDLLRRTLANRAERRRLRAAPMDLDDLRQDERCLPAGLSHPGSGLASGNMTEFYVAASDFEALTDDYLLEWDRANGNVVAHVVSDAVSSTAGALPLGAPMLLAADLAEHDDPRAGYRATEVLAALAGRVMP